LNKQKDYFLISLLKIQYAMEKKKRVGIWIRVSHDRQVQDESPEHHEAKGKAYADFKGWQVVEVYRLDAVSGKTTLELPMAKKMLNDLHSGHIEALVVSKIARLGRNTKELLEFSEIFQKENGDLVSLGENIDTSSPSGRMFFTIIAALAQWEREEIASRVAASVPIRAKMGKPLGGAAPYGYKWEGKELATDPTEAPIRKLMHELFIQEKRKKTVAAKLNASGYRTRNGSKFTNTTIGRLLRDSTAKGIRLANYTKSLGDGKKWVIKPESEWVFTPCPAIVSEDVWDECNRILDQQEKKRPPAKKTLKLFTGILECGCGGRMNIPSKGTKYQCPKCKQTAIGKDDLEEIYYENLKSFLLSDQDIEKFLFRADKAIEEKENQLKILSAERKRLQAEKDKIMKLYIDGQIQKENFNEYFNPFDEQLKQIEKSLPELEAERDFMKMEYLNADTIVEDAKSLYDRWNSIDVIGKRTIVEQITDCITISGDELNIEFSYNPAFFRNTPDWERNLTGS
jgi:site-specific DNA recombinase